jgi:predicted PurR-regulated permease PerM
MAERNIHVSVNPRSVLVGLLFILLGGLLWYLRDIALIVLTAVVIASAMEPAIRFFKRRGLNRIFSVLLMYLIVAGAFFGLLFIFVPPLLGDAQLFLEQLPQTLSSLDLADLTRGVLPGSLAPSFSSADLLQSITTTLADSTGGVFTTVSAFFGGLTSFVLIVVFSFYFCVQETGVDDFLRIITPVSEQAYVLHLWKRSQDKIGKWMQGQLILAVIVGVLLYLGLTVFGIPYALLLAVVAAVFELIPVFGQVLAAIPAVAVGFAHGGVVTAAIVAVIFLIIQQFESNLIYPVVVKKVVGVPPLLVILALIVGFKLFGFLGVLLSVPIAGAIQEFVSDVDRQKTRALARAGVSDDGE